ncbi:MAG: alpha/beta hydrolase [Gloeomargaritaceae cyanobacterium C42_A2020_066]|nr:alpha/beta hydrolase [Gloeomargaritaceae cyanobacterium C42_A2020_066]
MSFLSKFQGGFLALAATTTLVVGGEALTRPAAAAETLAFWYGPFQLTLPISDLREYVNTGTIKPELQSFLGLIPQQDREQLLGFMKVKLPLNVVAVSNLVYSPAGTQLINQISPVFMGPSAAVAPAVRGSVVLATASPQGLSLVSFMEQWPMPQMSLDVRELLAVSKSGLDIQSLVGGLMK